MMEAIYMNVIQSFSFKESLVLANIHVSPQKGHLPACHWMMGRDWAVFEKEFEKTLSNYFKKNILPGGKHKFSINSGIQVVVRISTTSTEVLLECLKSSKLEPSDSIVCFDCFIESGVSKSANEDSSHRLQELELCKERISKKNAAREVRKENNGISAAEPFLPLPISSCTRSHGSKNNASTAKETGEEIASTDAKRPRGRPKMSVTNEKYKERKQKCEGDTSKELDSSISHVDKTKVKSERIERKKAKERDNAQRETSKSDDKRSARKACKEETTENGIKAKEYPPIEESSDTKESTQLSRDAKVNGEKVTKEKTKRKKSSERDSKKYKKTRPPDENRPKDENANQLAKVPKEEEKSSRKTTKRNQKVTEKIHEALFGSFITDDEDGEETNFASKVEQRAIERTSADRSLKSIISERYKFSHKRNKLAASEFKDMEILDLHGMKQSEILASFDRYKHKLDKVFEAKRGTVNIDHFLVIFLVNQRMQFAMLQKLNDTYQTDPAKDQSPLLFNVMLPEWLLLLFMDRYALSRAQAVQQLFDQDKHNALYGGDTLDFEGAVRLRR